VGLQSHATFGVSPKMICMEWRVVVFLSHFLSQSWTRTKKLQQYDEYQTLRIVVVFYTTLNSGGTCYSPYPLASLRSWKVIEHEGVRGLAPVGNCHHFYLPIISNDTTAEFAT
jgi:hypothetical protein